MIADFSRAAEADRNERRSVSGGVARERMIASPRWRRWLRGEERAAALEKSAATPAGQGVLAVHHLGKGYRGRMVVQDVSLSVRRGEAVGLLGPNGAGKTTVFYMITGLVKPDKGEIELDGHDVTGLPMFQRARLELGISRRKPRSSADSTSRTTSARCSRSTNPIVGREAMLESLLEEFDIARVRSAPSISLSGGTAPVRDRPRPRRQAVFHAARRAFRRH